MIYVHVPFCRSFCTYCDFYSEIAAHCSEAFSEALCAEVRLRKDEITDQVNTLYIGGGTPSVLPLPVYASLLEALRETGHGGTFDEFTLEVNPDDIVEKGRGYVEGLLELGVNRISMGVQSFDDGILRWMNRRHDSRTSRQAYRILEDAGVKNISIDLIFGLPQLSDRMWKDTLESALEISARGVMPSHVSSYQLSVEPGSALAGMVGKGLWSEASEDLCRRQYDILCGRLGDAGYHHYEISNFALPGFEAVHNSAYWRDVPYVGLGPGAHSYLHSSGRHSRQWNLPDLKAYLDASRSGSFDQVREAEILTSQQLVLERIMLGLRTCEGLPADFLRRHCDPSALSAALSAGSLVPAGNTPSDGECLRIPESAFFISDSIIASLA